MWLELSGVSRLTASSSARTGGRSGSCRRAGSRRYQPAPSPSGELRNMIRQKRNAPS